MNMQSHRMLIVAIAWAICLTESTSHFSAKAADEKKEPEPNPAEPTA
jgi:hypothetical protein